MKAWTKLRRLEDEAARRGWAVNDCLACRARRGRIVLVDARHGADGICVVEPDYPVTCAGCGEVPEQVIETHVALVRGSAC